MRKSLFVLLVLGVIGLTGCRWPLLEETVRVGNDREASQMYNEKWEAEHGWYYEACDRASR